MLTNNGFTYTHDLDGNVTRKYNAAGEDHRYTWSADGRLTDVYFNDGLGDSPYTVHYDCNAYGEPVRRTLGTPDRVWLYDRGQLLGEFNAANGEQRVAEYLYNEDVDDPYAVVLGATTPSTIDYLESDQRGDVIGAYEGTTVTMSMNYGDWGVPSSGGGRQVGNVLWKGLHHDEYTGLYYMRARWYDPSSGRFLSEDPAGFAGGVNPYTFAGDDPINGFDPSGMHRRTLLGTVGGAICGIFCEFIGDVFSSGGTSQPSVAHIPPLRGLFPGDRAGSINGGIGVIASGVEFAGEGRTIGSNFKLYTSGWGGNQFVSTLGLENLGRALGHGTFYFGLALDTWHVAHGAPIGKALVNTGFGAIGTFGSWPGALMGATYYGVDQFVPGGWAAVFGTAEQVEAQNQAILGPGFNLFSAHGDHF